MTQNNALSVKVCFVINVSIVGWSEAKTAQKHVSMSNTKKQGASLPKIYTVEGSNVKI